MESEEDHTGRQIEGLRVMRNLKGKVEVAGNHWNYPKASKNRLVKQACDSVGASRHSLARKFNIGKLKSYVHRVLKKAGVTHYKHQKAPDTAPAQEQRQRTWLRKMSLRSRTVPESNPPLLSPELAQLSTFGLSWRQEFTGVAGKPERRISWSARSLNACGNMDWEHVHVRSRTDRWKTMEDIRKAAEKISSEFSLNSARSIL